jgi:hypothetical protein
LTFLIKRKISKLVEPNELNWMYNFVDHLLLGMLISSINGDSRGDCLVWRSKNGEFFSVGMGIKTKVPLKEVSGWYFILRFAETLSPKTIKITCINLYLSTLYIIFNYIFTQYVYKICLYMMFIIVTNFTIMF